MLHLKWLYHKLFSPPQPVTEPPKWMDLVLQELFVEDILQFSQTSKAAHQAAMAPALWKRLTKLYFPHLKIYGKKKHQPLIFFKEVFENYNQNRFVETVKEVQARLRENVQRVKQTELHIHYVVNGDFQYLPQLDYIEIIRSFNLAMKQGKSDIARELWEKLDNDQKSFCGGSVFIDAAKHNDFQMVKLLLNENRSIKIAICFAQAKGHYEMAAFLRDHKSPSKWNVRKIISRSLAIIFSTIQTNHFRKLSHNRNRPLKQALIAESTYVNFPGEAWLDRALSNPLLPGDLSQRFQIHEKPISSLASLCDLIKNLSSLAPIELLILRGHGNENAFALEGGDIYASARISCLEFLAKNATIILESCNTGYHSSETSMNVQKSISLSAPGRTVFASDFYTIKSSLSVQFQPELKVYALGINSDSIPSTLLGILWGYLRWGYFGSITKTQYSAYYPSIVTNEFHAVSTANTTTPIFEPLPPVESNCFYTGTYSILCAATTTFAREHLKIRHNNALLTLLATQGIQLGFQIVTTSTSMLPTILCLNLLSLPGTFLQYSNSTLLNLRSLVNFGYLGFLFYKSYQQPEQFLTTTLELTTAVAGSLIGDKFGQYAYRHFVRSSSVQDKPVKISRPKV